jgi:hypothetical protein
MQTYWILDRLFSDRQIPNFSFNSTVNWMHALAILVNEKEFSDEELKKHFSGVNRRITNQGADNIVFENTLMAFHNLAALDALKNASSDKYDTVRLAIISWYYCIYFVSSAMIAGASGVKSETHAGTAKIWHSDFIQSKLLVEPFSLHIDSLVKKDAEATIATLRGSNPFTVNSALPKTKDQALGAVIAYLSGTTDHEAEKIENRVRSSSEFKKLGVANFRTKEAKELRDKSLQKGYVNFLTTSFRYRGKANYRDSVFLSYGAKYTPRVEQLTNDLVAVAEKYLRMAVHYLALRVEKGTWNDFTNDLEKNSRLSKEIDVLRM